MEYVYQLLLDIGYPERGVDWLRRHRLVIIALMAIAAWALFIFAGWLIWSLIT